jgi:pectate lyase|tara:strand:- start:99 stop:632 length:534 start_codon:yes stop_codon:yes gene_type:complete
VDEITTRDGTSTLTLGANGKTLNIPSGCTISNSGTATGFGGGKINQVVNAVNTTDYSTTSSTYNDITGLTLNITPTATDSKILILMQITCKCNNGSGTASNGSVRLLRDSSELQNMNVFTQLNIGNGNPDSLIHSGSHIYLDSPSSTSQLTFKYQGKTTDGTFSAFVKNMTAMEVLA